MKTCRPMWFLASVCLLAGCADSGQDELAQWMAVQRTQTKPKIAPISEPKKFTPQAYIQDANAGEPFSSQKLTLALRQQSSSATSNAALVAPEINRRKEPLESMPLDSVQMVGSLDRGGQLVALVKVENLLYQVKPGNYLGQNFGRITKVSETEVSLREIVQDAAGEWIERVTALQLQERSK